MGFTEDDGSLQIHGGLRRMAEGARPAADGGAGVSGLGPRVPEPTAEPRSFPRFMSVRQVAEYLQINEKKIYALASEGKIPGTKVTGKWLFPRDLVDRWLLESSHGGILTDRLILAGSDDPLLRRVVLRLADAAQATALVSYSPTGTRLGLSLLANHRADACALHWGPVAESHLRHPALLRQFPNGRQWILVRICHREQGLLVSRKAAYGDPDLEALLQRPLRWVFRQEGAGSQRFLQETAVRLDLDLARIRPLYRAQSEHAAAAWLAMGQADIAPGTRGAATEFGLDFHPMGWEALDLALFRGIYFRALFQELLQSLKSPEVEDEAGLLGGYNLSETGRMVWSDGG